MAHEKKKIRKYGRDGGGISEVELDRIVPDIANTRVFPILSAGGWPHPHLHPQQQQQQQQQPPPCKATPTHTRHTHCHSHSHSHSHSHTHKHQPPPLRQRRGSSSIVLGQGGDHPESILWRFDCDLAGEPDVVISPPPPPPPPSAAVSRTTTL
ncbi:hypothetical protein ANTPLA_LOCUS10969 [Anthophora plagiata]